MGTVITPYTEDFVEAVKAFNGRLLAGGAALTFPESHIPAWLPKIDGRNIYHEYYLAVEDGAVRGAYILKHQPFYINGSTMPLAEYRLPLSEGQVDKQFASVAVQMYLDAMRKQPQLYTVGIGGYQEAAAQMLISAGWNTSLVPFYFRVLHPARFLRNIVYLRTTPGRRLAMDALAMSGLGAVAVHLYQARKTRHRPRDTSAVAYHVESGFGPWADEIWQDARDNYAMIAVRDAAILNILYPASDPRWIRLKVTFEGRIVGWMVVLNVAMQGHNYFGNMRVGSLIDCLALPGMESKVTRAATRYLKRNRADIVVTNLSHRAWRPALESAGCYEGPSNFIFAASKKVSALLHPFDEKKEQVHMTRGDGGGPQNLLAARK
ncbi:MAG: hypothetical protein HY288_06565 [Planctomycetia bacterium]|nr:hypothetical protein [Planctomycetia bacterium]